MRLLRLRPKPKIKYCDVLKAPDLREISDRAPLLFSAKFV